MALRTRRRRFKCRRKCHMMCQIFLGRESPETIADPSLAVELGRGHLFGSAQA
jgi:hypothetical protein